MICALSRVYFSIVEVSPRAWQFTNINWIYASFSRWQGFVAQPHDSHRFGQKTEPQRFSIDEGGFAKNHALRNGAASAKLVGSRGPDLGAAIRGSGKSANRPDVKAVARGRAIFLYDFC